MRKSLAQAKDFLIKYSYMWIEFLELNLRERRNSTRIVEAVAVDIAAEAVVTVCAELVVPRRRPSVRRGAQHAEAESLS